ncbi:aldo/keto reductase [Paenibacillus sp. N1-5-1-14]|uniref:aldo/keto reductase n=1 Tax=Paenibacillus radicibacter TaxID=2972488 RepID=UPI00215949D8|nr:aldo/keto reductase [Paenibacillus radicibacter]MCR8644251.1 aldo/keto reductase [Paenibacillus radicibacter]
MKRNFGKSGIKTGPLGLGCWAIGGLFTLDGIPDGWGNVDDQESILAIQTAIEMGVTFFDTADAYGVGHSEEVLGRAIQGKRDQVVVATKFGYTNNEATKEVFGKYDVSPEYVRYACERSLQRLGTDYIDLYQIHVGKLNDDEISSVIVTLDDLVQEGKIRSYGWSTWDMSLAEQFAVQSSGAAIQHSLNVLHDDPHMVEICEQREMVSINNSPLAMGLLSGKFNANSILSEDDVRGSSHEWVRYFKNGKPIPEFLEQLEAVKEILTSSDRTTVQGALAWIWGRSAVTLPVPGFKTRKQVAELAGAVEKGALTASQMQEIDRILERSQITVM